MNKFTKAIAAITLMMVVAVSCKKPGDSDNESVSGTINGHEYVDLGLPSGTWWATCNVGASTPEERGDYFAWAEVEPKSDYNWATYKYLEDGDFHKLNKYCTNPEYGLGGSVDDRDEMLYPDDPAKLWYGNSYGKMWRTPTFEDWDELKEYCDLEWITRNGVNGMLFKGPNGKSIFFPAAGSRMDYGLDDIGEFGVYWTRSLYVETPSHAWGFAFNSEECFFGAAERCMGQTIRPVIHH